MTGYREYVADKTFIEDYSVYQRRYADEIRESDKVIIRIVEELGAKRILDVGCSTGNLLRHLNGDGLELTGADLTPEVLWRNRLDPGLDGITFAMMDLLDLRGEYDLVIVNAVLYLLGDEEFAQAVESIVRVAPRFVAFDFFHDFKQELTINEVSESHPEGLTLHMRSYERTRELLAPYFDAEFRPFEIPIPLPENDELLSYTRNGQTFRGALYQPWCHLIAR